MAHKVLIKYSKKVYKEKSTVLTCFSILFKTVFYSKIGNVGTNVDLGISSHRIYESKFLIKNSMK